MKLESKAALQKKNFETMKSVNDTSNYLKYTYFFKVCKNCLKMHS